MKIRAVRKLGASVLLVALSGACGSGSNPSATPVTVFDMSADPGKGLPITSAGHHVLTTATLRSSLDSLLADHASLVAVLVHEVGTGQQDTMDAVRALGANTAALTNAITFVYGPDGGRAFAQLWEQHTQFFVDYAAAARSHDDGAKEQAEEKLRDYQSDFASFVRTATAGRLPLIAVTRLLHEHVEDLTAYIDADVAGRSDDAARLLARSVAHMHVIARAVSGAIASQHLKTVGP